MGLIERFFGMVFGGGRNAVAETIEVFRENADKGAQRDVDLHATTLAQFAEEFARTQRGPFDRIMDGINRVPRPAMALGTLALFAAAMVDPIWFASRMQGIALVPEPLWWLLGAIVSFYFGARHQSKGQDFQRDMAQSLSRVQKVVGNLEDLDTLKKDIEQTEAPGAEPVRDANPALAEWRKAA